MALAEEHFLRAIDIDPEYALAYVSLASTYKYQVESSGLSMEESLERRQPLLDKAFELDPFSAEAYAARAFFHLDSRNEELAESDFLKSIALNPSYATAYQWYSTLLRRQDRFEEALAQMEIAAELDPIAPYVQSTLAVALWAVGRTEESLAVIRNGIDRFPELTIFPLQMANYQSAAGNLGEAQWWYDKVREMDPRGAQAWRWRCLYFLNLGDVQSAVIAPIISASSTRNY